jgi:hypothetical protein
MQSCTVLLLLWRRFGADSSAPPTTPVPRTALAERGGPLYGSRVPRVTVRVTITCDLSHGSPGDITPIPGSYSDYEAYEASSEQKGRTYEKMSYRMRSWHLFRVSPHHLGSRVLCPSHDLHVRHGRRVYLCSHDPGYVRVVFFPP